jgi:hypothetical protein
VHLQSDAVDGHATRPQIPNEVVNAVRLGAQALAAVVVVKE